MPTVPTIPQQQPQTVLQATGGVEALRKPVDPSKIARVQGDMGQMGVESLPGVSSAVDAKRSYEVGREIMQAVREGRYADAAKAWGMSTVYAISSVGNLAADLMGATGMPSLAMVIDAWHGSPHTFDKFKLDAIGTGEGAQAYGHGLYFTDTKEIAESYRKMGSWRNTEWTPNDGSLFRTQLDVNPEDLLDWDKPLSQQSEKVRAALEKMGLDLNAFSKWTGQDLYDGVGARGTKVGSTERQSAASDLLREAGIPGIRYLDGMSRNKGEGSYNYVIFDDSKIAIKERNGKPVTK